MKTRLFNKGKGWYVSATNYKDKEDKAYMSVYFTKDCEEPTPTFNASGYAMIDIDVLESFYVSYNKKIAWKIQKYIEVKNEAQSEQKQPHNSNKINLTSDDLPWYQRNYEQNTKIQNTP